VEHFEDDDDNDNDSDDVEDVSVHGSWVTRRYPLRQANIIAACDFRLPPHPAVPRAILNDLGERIGDLVEKELRFRHSSCLVREASAILAQPKSAPRLSGCVLSELNYFVQAAAVWNIGKTGARSG
jgi:hypothetical protein